MAMHCQLALVGWQSMAGEGMGMAEVEVPGLEATGKGLANSEASLTAEAGWAVMDGEERATCWGHVRLAGGLAAASVEVIGLAVVGWVGRGMAGEDLAVMGSAVMAVEDWEVAGWAGMAREEAG